MEGSSGGVGEGSREAAAGGLSEAALEGQILFLETGGLAGLIALASHPDPETAAHAARGLAALCESETHHSELLQCGVTCLF